MARIFASYAHKGLGEGEEWRFGNGVYDMDRIETDLDVIGLEHRIREARSSTDMHFITVLFFTELTVSPT